MQKILIIICLALVAFAANAQTFTDDLRREKNGQGKVVVNQSEEIDRLVNNTEVQQTVVTPVQGLMTVPEHKQNVETGTTNAQPVTPATPVRPETKDNADERKEKPADRTPERRVVAPSTDYSTSDGAVVNTNKKIMRHSYKTTGYRIQVYSGGNKRVDRTKCEQIAARLKAVYPDLPIYVHFYSPSWKCRAGNYTDMSEAKAMLKNIRALGYNQACLVKGTVNIQY